MTTTAADISKVEREEGASRGRYFVRSGDHLAEMTYTRIGTSGIIIDHTEVPTALGGQGVGVAMVQKAVNDARAEHRYIIPLCPFAKAQFQRHAGWQDVLKRPAS